MNNSGIFYIYLVTIEILTTFLKFRFRQLQREAISLGVLYTAFVLIAYFFLFYLAWQTISVPAQQHYSILCLFPIVAFYSSRNDNRFLKKLYPNYRVIYISEYLVLAFPFLFIAAIKGSFGFLGCVVMACILMALFPLEYKKTSKTGFQLLFIPSTAFEWKSGLRQFGISIISLWVLALGLTYFPAISIVFLWMLHSLIISFYQRNEGKDILRIHSGTAETYLIGKIRTGIFLQLIIQAIPAIVYVIFHPEHWWIMLFLILQSMLSLTFSIIVKYAFLDPGSKSGPTTFYQSVGVISFLIPFIIPVPLLLGAAKYKTAIKRLNIYGIKSR